MMLQIPLRSFAAEKDNQESLSISLFMDEYNHMTGSEFLSLRKIVDLSGLLSIDPFLLKICALNPEYRSFSIPKRNGELRKIEAPASGLKGIQKSLNFQLQGVYLSMRPENVHGFIIRHAGNTEPFGIVSNARAMYSNKIRNKENTDNDFYEPDEPKKS